MPLFLQPGIPFICGSEQCTRSCCRAPQPVNVFRWDKPRKGRGPGYASFHPILVSHPIFPSNNLKFSFQSLEESTSPASQLCLWLSEDCCPALLCPPGSKQRVLLWDTPPLLQPPGLSPQAEMLLQPQGLLLAAWLL